MRRKQVTLPAPAWWRELAEARRQELGLSQSELAQAVGVSQPAIHALLTGPGDASSRHVLAVSAELRIDAPPEARLLAAVARLAKSNPTAIDRALAYLESVANAEDSLVPPAPSESGGRKSSPRKRR